MAAPLQGQTGCCSGRSSVGGDLQLDVQSHLNKREGEVLALMSEAVKLSNSCTVVRVAGGWVRDKLLGLEVSTSYNSSIIVVVTNCQHGILCYGVALVACSMGLCGDITNCAVYNLS